MYKSFYGSCVSSTDAAGGALPYVIILVLVNLSSAVLANYQAYEARNVNVEFQESKYIGLATASMLQAFLSEILLMIVISLL